MNDINDMKIGGIPVLMAVAFSSGDGWKDSTSTGQSLYVWGVVMPPPYVGNSCPRIGRGRYTYAVSPELHGYRGLKEDEYYQLSSFFKGSPALQEEAAFIADGIASGSFLEIPDMKLFLATMKSPNEGGIKGTYERLGIKTTTEAAVEPLSGGRL